MSNLRANAARFQEKEKARLQKAAHEERRLQIVRRHRETNVRTLRDILQNYPCPVSQPGEAGEEATAALLEVAAGFSSHLPAAESIKTYETQVHAALARKRAARDTQESRLLADIVGAVVVDPELVEITDAGDGQRVPTLPDMSKPWCNILALALKEGPAGEKTDASALFEGLEPADAQGLRQGLEGAQALAKAALKDAYVNMVRTADDLLRKNKAERAEEAEQPKLPEPAAPAPAGSLEALAVRLAADLAYAEGVLASMVADATVPPDEGQSLEAARKRISALVETLKKEATAVPEAV